MEATSSTAWRNIPRPALLLDLMAELGTTEGFLAWTDQLTKDHDRVAAYLGSVGIDQCEEWRERYQNLSAMGSAGRFGAERLDLQSELSSVVKALLSALHSTSSVARYLDCDRSTVIDVAFPRLGLDALEKAEELLSDPSSTAFKDGKVRPYVLAEALGVRPNTARSVAVTLGYMRASASTAKRDAPAVAAVDPAERERRASRPGQSQYFVPLEDVTVAYYGPNQSAPSLGCTS